MALRKRPINAGVPAPGSAEPTPPAGAATEPEQQPSTKPVAAKSAEPSPKESAPKPAVSSPSQKPKKFRPPRRHIPLALKAIGATIALAVAFIVAAILGGRGSPSSEAPPGAAAPVNKSSVQATKGPSNQTAEDLGYPAFATNNTTRVGGDGPAANAAGVALAAFPSASAAERPLAVTILDEADWQAGIAASVLMSSPVRAPILISSPGGVPEPTAQAFDALAPQGSGATLGAQAFVVGDAAAPTGLLHTKHIEPGAPAVMAAEIETLRDELLAAPQHLLVASAEDPAYAMPAAAWAARSGDPVLFAETKKLPGATAKALRRHANVPVYVLGPPSAISAAVIHEIGKIDPDVHRVSGSDPVSNAIALARYSAAGFGWGINDPGHGFVVARSDSPLDAAAAAPLSASGTWGPLLLTDSADTLPAALRGYLLDVKPGYTTNPTRAFYNHVWVIGDQEAIDVNQQAEIDKLAELTKIGGGT